jgi:hypothetical protein
MPRKENHILIIYRTKYLLFWFNNISVRSIYNVRGSCHEVKCFTKCYYRDNKFSRQERGITRQPRFHYSKGQVFYSLPWCSDLLWEPIASLVYWIMRFPSRDHLAGMRSWQLIYIVSSYKLPWWRRKSFLIGIFSQLIFFFLCLTP